MAAEAPITDILCEAMEYLSKLGTNLRKRSENLKEKRISKSKLKNTHAVQKAASKVLLICELSKKSLDNVESGIRKVLSLVDASQESTAISGNDTDTKNETNYHYFRYKSRRLRIVQKIPLKHYTSVKVIANKMPSSLQEKYPVYYDCKLKRQRLIKRRKYKVKRKKSPNSLSDKKVGDTHSESSNDELKDNSLTDKTTREESDGKKENNKTNYNNSDSENEVMDTNNDNIDKTNNKCIENIGDIENCSQDKNEDNNQSIIEISDTPQKSTDIHTSESDGETKRGCVNETKLKIRFADVYSDSNDETHTKKSKANFNNDDNNVDDSSNTETNVRKLKVTESDHNSQSSTVSESATPEIQNLNETGAENDCEQKCESPTTVKSIDDQNDLSGGTKPLIRCVNLSKLLKPNVIDKNMLNDNIEDVKKADVISKKKVRDFEKYNSCNVVKKTLKDDDDKYLSQKKKEVAEFKAKDFSINIMQLPAFTKSFLIKHSLKKILKKGDVICELSPANNALTSSKIKAVKNALLYDSESDEKIESNKVKKSLLEDSDSENNVSDKERNKVPFDSVKSKEQDKIHDKDRRESLHHDSNPEECEKEVTVETSNTVMETDETEIEPTNVCENIDRQGTPVPMEQNCKSQESGSDTNTKKNVESYEQTNLITPTKSHKAKFSLLNDSSDEKCDKNTEETPTKRNAKSKSSLLKDSSAEEFAGFDFEEQEESINKTVPKVKSKSTDSHDVDMDTQEITKEKRKILKSKRKHSRKTREEKRSHHNSTSSDSEEEKIISRRSRKKSRISSSSSEDIKKKTSRIKSQTLDSDTSNSDKNKEETIGQVDGAVDEQSDSSVDKMVRSKAKPSGSSSLNSDNQDASDKVIDGLTNLNSLNKNRQHGTSLKENKDTDSMRRSSRAKKTPLLGEELLKAEPSDDSSSNASNDDENNLEDLPAVTIPGLNGDSVAEHLAKDDLLGETDSDNGQSEEEDNDSDEDNVKSKRRKQNTKSSDSDGGTNSKKRTDDKLSDFEDSEDESSEPIKKSKRKKKGSDSDASVDSNEGGVKSKGRKQNTISSDSDGGTNRKKRTNDKLSDFEDSEDESSEPIKKSKRKKKGSDSDASVDSNEGGQKKRRRIKTLNDSDASGSDTENEGKNKHGRKNIRKVMGKNQLEEATKKAAREEKERIARIAERQKMYNNLDFDESGKPDEVVLEKVVLDFDPETKEPLIQVDRGLVKMLKPHQANGIKFMWDACFESVKRIKKDKGSGCILAHCMGLGKTLQVISLTHTLFTHSDLTGVNRVLVVCPLSTVLNWVNEFNMWLKHAEAEFDVDVYELSRFKQNSERAYQLQQWFDGGGVCVLGYEMFRNLSADNPKKFKKKMLKSFQESLVDPGPDLVICDEGHLLKNEKTSLSQSMNRVKTLRRIVLTGTPLQNNLKEYYCMVQFVKPNLLGKYSEYLNRFVNPITNGQYTDSNEHDIRIMKRRSHVLHKMLDGAVQRRDYGVLAPFLPPKHEYVLFITLTDVQIKLYRHYLENYSRQPSSGRTGFLFPDFQSLQRIWTHPLVLKYNSERYEIMQQKKRDKEEEDSDGSQGSLADFINDDSTPEETTTEESTDDSSDGSDDSRKKKKKKSNKKDTKASTRRGTRANPTLAPVEDDVNKSDDVIEIKNDNPTEWWMKLVDESELDDMRNSHKLVLLFNILRQCENIGDKLLVFSQSLYSLDLIEHFLKEVDDATQEGRIDERLGGHVGSWSPGIDYFRLDGSTSCENRSIWCKNFNRVDNPRARLFLISTRAGGLGINLVAANRVVIFDVSWNPSHDVQSIFRVYRFGQKKPCYVYRFLAMGTMEEKIYERQVTKQAISKRVIDEQQIDRHYAENDLAELYKFEERPSEPRPLPTLPKDRLFAEMLKEHEAEIYKYHEHDSLLENKEEETLSEEERKAAWEDFENEKTRPPPAPFPSTWPMHNGMVPGLLAQQQQQMAIVGLASLLRKDMPNITDDQIRNMLPLLMTSPYVMQKANDYLPNMMNPAMMNTMNAGSVGGTSGLQYEPPWQRQHQQQQQMRLQQLMQHQNQMGAKVYAGGLGSRDPVAMALQQQRAREIMMGGAGSRPRGRPPMQPRVPTPSSQDVVNLDSD